MPCRLPSCNTKKQLDSDGFCQKHKLHLDALEAAVLNQAEFKKLNDKLDNVIERFDKLEKENKELKQEVKSLKIDNSDLKAKFNVMYFKNDALNQYGRKESFRIHKYPEPTDRDADNSETALFAVANKLGIAISKGDIQRCHRVGKRRRQPRSIIVKLKCWSKRMEFIKNKSKLYDVSWKNIDHENVSNGENGSSAAEATEDQSTTNTDDAVEERSGKKFGIFVTEDLSPFRLKLLHYVKDWNNNEGGKIFDRITTRNGNIVCRVKVSEEWHTISSPEDFEKAGIAMNQKEFPELMF